MGSTSSRPQPAPPPPPPERTPPREDVAEHAAPPKKLRARHRFRKRRPVSTNPARRRHVDDSSERDDREPSQDISAVEERRQDSDEPATRRRAPAISSAAASASVEQDLDRSSRKSKKSVHPAAASTSPLPVSSLPVLPSISAYDSSRSPDDKHDIYERQIRQQEELQRRIQEQNHIIYLQQQQQQQQQQRQQTYLPPFSSMPASGVPVTASPALSYSPYATQTQSPPQALASQVSSHLLPVSFDGTRAPPPRLPPPLHSDQSYRALPANQFVSTSPPKAFLKRPSPSSPSRVEKPESTKRRRVLFENPIPPTSPKPTDEPFTYRRISISSNGTLKSSVPSSASSLQVNGRSILSDPIPTASKQNGSAIPETANCSGDYSEDVYEEAFECRCGHVFATKGNINRHLKTMRYDFEHARYVHPNNYVYSRIFPRTRLTKAEYNAIKERKGYVPAKKEQASV
ncbi:uncharacterized protein V2V93DRAFT_365871 [Kockiozyma suomiensis]|uniref:uncharacterized protein n=1 Tax=Kockiozyma suomiensis TaxID=1337062 RepID=UPI003343B07E